MKNARITRRGFMQSTSAAGALLMDNARGTVADGRAAAADAGEAASRPVPGASGQGNMRFKVLYTSAHLPPAAQKALVKAHGGFAVDRRPGKGEVYFFLPGAGLLKISSSLDAVTLLPTPAVMLKTNLHDTTIWTNSSGASGEAFLVFPANEAGKIFTTTLSGDLVSVLNAPTYRDQFEQPEIAGYFLGGGNFAPTGVAYLDGLYYVSTGYCQLDFVLTARVSPGDSARIEWNDLAFGGKGDGRSQFRTAHAIAVCPATTQLDVTDRPHSEIKRFSRYGHFLSSLKMPMGSLPCSIDWLDGYALVPTLAGPDPSQGAPIYLFRDGWLVSSIFPKSDLGLANFAHNHKAVLHRREDKLCIIVQAWNPGDFAILEQV